MENEKQKSRVVLVVFASIFLTLLLAAVAFYVIFLTSFFSAVSLGEVAEGAGDRLGAGISLALSLVFMIICAAACVVIAVPELVVSILLDVKGRGKARIYGRICWIFGAFSVLGSIATTIICALSV